MDFSQTKSQIKSLLDCFYLINDNEGNLEKINNNLNLLADYSNN
jgi:hypothetical protein